MKLLAPIAERFSNAMPRLPSSRTSFQLGPTPQQQYTAYGRAYTSNEIVFAAVEMLATSAGEPHIVGRRWQRESPKREQQRLRARGLSLRDAYDLMIANGFFRDLPDHPLVRLLSRPNPWMSRGQFWGTVVMDRALAGNAYAYKARVKDGRLRGAVVELWRLRPDRVKIIPSPENFIDRYEYGQGNDVVSYAPEDIIHFKTRNPLNDYYGMPPLMAVAGRVDIDEYMKSFLRRFFEGGGTGPGAILSVEQKLTQENRDLLVDKYKQTVSQGMHELLVLDQAKTSFSKIGLDRGLRDALPKEIDAVQEARIAMAFGIPGSILGLLIGYESSSYANKRQDWQVFWDLTMTPLLSDLDDDLNMQLVPDFGGIDEVLFDLSDIRALQEDVDAMQKRHRDNLVAGLESWEEAREAVGLDPGDKSGTFYVPTTVTPMPGTKMRMMPEPMPSPNGTPEHAAALIVVENPMPKPGKTEERQEFVSRCMADPMMLRDFPDQEQRAAVCYRQWRESENSAAIPEVRHRCGALVARDVIGNPELHCDRCMVNFRAIPELEALT